MSISTIIPGTNRLSTRSFSTALRPLDQGRAPHSTALSYYAKATHRRANVHPLSRIDVPRRPCPVPHAAGADEVASAIRALAGPILTVAGSLAGASGAAAVVLYRLGTIDKTITDKFNDLKEKIDKQGKDLEAKIDKQGKGLEAKIDKQGKELEAKIDKQGKALEAKIDKQEGSLAGITGKLGSLANEVANIQGKLSPWYPPVASAPPPTPPPVPTSAQDKTPPSAKRRPSI